MLLRVEHGKGAKDRYTTLSPALLEILRAYFRIVRPAGEWLFPSWRPDRHISAGLLQRACREAWQLAGLPGRRRGRRQGHRVEPREVRGHARKDRLGGLPANGGGNRSMGGERWSGVGSGAGGNGPVQRARTERQIRPV